MAEVLTISSAKKLSRALTKLGCVGLLLLPIRHTTKTAQLIFRHFLYRYNNGLPVYCVYVEHHTTVVCSREGFYDFLCHYIILWV